MKKKEQYVGRTKMRCRKKEKGLKTKKGEMVENTDVGGRKRDEKEKAGREEMMKEEGKKR